MTALPGRAALAADRVPPGIQAVSWRTVRSPDPRGGAEFEALMQTADIDRSDLEFAGMMVRCHERRLEPIVVIVTPLPPRATADVTLASEGWQQTFKATPIPTGAGLAIPLDVARQMQGPWRNARDLTIAVRTSENTIKGAIALGGLAMPLSQLEQACASGPPQGDALK